MELLGNAAVLLKKCLCIKTYCKRSLDDKVKAKEIDLSLMTVSALGKQAVLTPSDLHLIIVNKPVVRMFFLIGLDSDIS